MPRGRDSGVAGAAGGPTVAAALRLRLSLLRRSQAAEKLEALRLRGPHLPTREVVDSLRATRDKA